MRLGESEARARLATHDHGVLSTAHPTRGVDAVPAAYALDGDAFLTVPVDTVKAKSSLRLQRERNLKRDPRATLLAEHWDRHDWSKLWWVRARLVWLADPGPVRIERLAALLALRYPQYGQRPFARLLVFQVLDVDGWAAESPRQA
jgi:Pyridoxamine 5'-phosphate oxidase